MQSNIRRPYDAIYCKENVGSFQDVGAKVYQIKPEDGKKAFVYLLDEAMQMDKIGMISVNLADKIAMTVTESSYRVTAEIISGTCGQSISHGGAWNLIYVSILFIKGNFAVKGKSF